MKTCTRCHATLPLEMFQRNVKGKDGHAWRCKSCCSAAKKAHYGTHREEILERQRIHAETNRARRRQMRLEWYRRKRGDQFGKQKPRPPGRGRTQASKDRNREAGKRFREKVKVQVFEAYGGFVCQCCGETEPSMLALDHVARDGAAHRREIGRGHGVYTWIRKNNFPKGIFRVLCHNCNYASFHNDGVCPHQESATRTLKLVG